MNICIAIPSYGPIDHEHLWCVESLEKLCKETDGIDAYVLRAHGCALINQARGALCAQAIEKQADVVLFIDDDILFNAADALELCLRTGEGYDIIGAPCSTRKKNGFVNVRFPRGTKSVPFFDDGLLLEVDAIGMGLTAIGSHVLLRLADTSCPKLRGATGLANGVLYPFFADYIKDGVWFGEDIGFCLRAKEQGFRVHVDTRMRTQHKGAYPYIIEDVATFVPQIAHLELNLQPGETSE